ncbi:trihelix transcription factor ASIL1-like [Olea europaea subsp. europaea]|uniref:Trihelix transcription factor ASIL1-like n=1 Tax=Olea europaea subsp. europaea TaxID=158383 RepID=A0A8S0QIN1_OLEEU|nr:trihelix transcription factor ASIL1-like [Olea europaea subsp. europaea]
MDDTREDDRYPSNPYGINDQEFPIRNATYVGNVGNEYVEDEDNDDDNEDMEYEDDDDDDGGGSSVQRIKDDYADDDVDDDDEDEDEDEDDYGNLQRHPKKRKLKSLLSSYEFAPRVPAPSSATPAVPKPSYGGRNPHTDWTESETVILLDAWGDRFLKHGRKSLRSEEWQEVSKKVSQESKIERTDTQCRNRLDTLKKKYKKEKMKLGESWGSTSKWVYFKKMDMLLSSGPQQAGLSCGVDSGEYTFMNPKVYLNSSNGMDEMRDSPGNSESTKGEEGVPEGLPPKKTRNEMGNGASLKLLADSIQKFSDIYEKIENSKRQQMLELEKMRMDFHRDLEMQKRQILERAQAEIVKIRQGDEDNDVSAENVSG